jgi:hypothetical protein
MERDRSGRPYQWEHHLDLLSKGIITNASGTTNQKWLESAFLEKQAGSRKIIFTHSTRVANASKDNHGK